jgi:hypothetical protein
MQALVYLEIPDIFYILSVKYLLPIYRISTFFLPLSAYDVISRHDIVVMQ